MCNSACSPIDSEDIKEGHFEIAKMNTICNVREYLKGNIRFRARPIQNGNNYSSLLIGSPNHPYNGTPPLVVLLPSGMEVNLAEVSVNH